MTDETLILLGTGNATVTKCFNTCFAIKTGEEYFLVDTGGGNGIMTQLEKEMCIRDRFILLAVYIPEQDPQVGQTFASNSLTSSSVIVPAA